ncbi:MAG: AMP-binding protein [Candidatus Lokiarchaeota archaeon]|nr:AMP-binding protein [Candidatus Lokiarchaeota archaeon]MBD3201570.1 AMP-binding protein [Candidatus Lokiarchaeota archaeon]
MSEKTYDSKFWKNNWDEGLKDLDPSVWEKSFPDSLRKSLVEDKDKIALAFLGVEITFGELELYSNQFANMLLDHGFKKGDVVGINLANIPEYVIALIGTHKIGCIVSGVSPLMSAVQIQYQLNDLGAQGKKVALVTLDAIFEAHIAKIADKIDQLKLVVVANVGGFLPKFKQILGKLLGKIPKGKVTPLPGKTVIEFHKDILQKYPTDLPDVKVGPDDLAFIQYTGGTTGPPKGAMLTHRNAVSDLLIVQSWLDWERGNYFALSGFPFFHIAGLFFCENCLYLGWGQCLIPNPRDTKHICDELEEYKPTALVNVPSLFQILLKEPKFAELDHSSLEVCISAASPFPKESQVELEKIVGEGKLLEVYGMTECSPLTVMNPSKGEKKLGHIGLPIMNVDLKLVDPETDKEVPVGEAGEILVRGPMVMQGYYNKPEETQKAIDDDKFMHTGDVAIMDDMGYLRIVDRTKDMIIVSGYKVFSSKVEDSLSKHPAVELIALIGVPNPDRPGSEIVKAYIQLDPSFEYTSIDQLKEEIEEFARENCAPYEVPKIIEITEEIPLTAVGKIDKKVLRKK